MTNNNNNVLIIFITDIWGQYKYRSYFWRMNPFLLFCLCLTWRKNKVIFHATSQMIKQFLAWLFIWCCSKCKREKTKFIFLYSVCKKEEIVYAQENRRFMFIASAIITNLYYNRLENVIDEVCNYQWFFWHTYFWPNVYFNLIFVHLLNKCELSKC